MGLAPGAGLTGSATLTQLMGPVFAAWAPYLRRVPPSRKTVANWAWERDKTGFPPPLPLPGAAGGAQRYAVTEVLAWYCERSAPRG